MEKDNLKPIEEMEEETQEEEATGSEENEEQEEETQDEYTLPDDESIPEKFRGKTPKDVLQSYVELERMIGKKAETLAEEMLQQRGISITKEQKKDIKDVADDIDFDKMDFTKMSPKDFAKWMLGEVEKRAEAKARHIVTQTSSLQHSVQNEVKEAQEKYPQLKTNEEYRETVLAFIENASARGETLSLDAACQKVNKLMGVTEQKKEEKEEVKKPNPVKRAGVEKAKPVDSGENMDEEERVKQGMMSAGGGKSPLGGLGI